MRIISGRNKGRRINPPKNLPVRPTTDFAKESLFNILNNQIYFDEIKVLDLFAGTGNISLEFASRDAISVHSVDLNHRCIDFIKKTAQELKLENISTLKANAFKYLENSYETFDLIFADPPYDLENAGNVPDLVFENKLLNEGGMMIMEHSQNYSFADHPNFSEHRKYGSVNFSFFTNKIS